jgi:uncharacterized membrane protein YgcG
LPTTVLPPDPAAPIPTPAEYCAAHNLPVPGSKEEAETLRHNVTRLLAFGQQQQRDTATLLQQNSAMTTALASEQRARAHEAAAYAASLDSTTTDLRNRVHAAELARTEAEARAQAATAALEQVRAAVRTGNVVSLTLTNDEYARLQGQAPRAMSAVLAAFKVLEERHEHELQCVDDHRSAASKLEHAMAQIRTAMVELRHIPVDSAANLAANSAANSTGLANSAADSTGLAGSSDSTGLAGSSGSSGSSGSASTAAAIPPPPPTPTRVAGDA